MSVELDKRKILGVQDRVSQVLSSSEFSPAEVIFGLSEFIGRMIIGYVPGTWIQKKEIAAAASQHIERSIKVGLAQDAQRI